MRRAPDALGNRVIGYVGGIDMNRNRLDTPGHHGRAWRPPDQVVEHAVGAGVPRRARPDHRPRRRRRRPDVRPALGLRHSRSRPAARLPPSSISRSRRPAPTDQDEVPPQPARHLVQVGRSGYAPNPAGGSTPLPWSPARRGDDPARRSIDAIEQRAASTSTSRTSTSPRPTTYIHALLEASVREPPLRLLIVIPTSSDQLFGDIRRREMFERLRDDPRPVAAGATG